MFETVLRPPKGHEELARSFNPISVNLLCYEPCRLRSTSSKCLRPEGRRGQGSLAQGFGFIG
jgi:hypothetical protein